jgi:hypothetical protein
MNEECAFATRLKNVLPEKKKVAKSSVKNIPCQQCCVKER